MFKPDTDITQELQDTMDALSRTGGGEVSIPPGTYHFRTLELKTGVTLRSAQPWPVCWC